MNLPVAYAINKKNMKKYNKGGVVNSASVLKEAADYELDKESSDMSDGGMIAKAIMAKKMAEGGMVEDDSDLYSPGESELHETPGHLMEDGEHEVEGMGDKEAIMKKGMMARILGSVRLKNMGG